MAYKHYQLRLVIRIIFLLTGVILTGASYLLIPRGDFLFLPLVLTMILVAQVVDIILYLNSISRELSRFISNLEQGELSERFEVGKSGYPFQALYRSFNLVVSRLENSSLEREAHYTYLQDIMSHIDTGIVSIHEDGRIVIMNHYARDLLNLKENSTWNDLKRFHPELAGSIEKMKGRGNRLLEVGLGNTRRQLSINQRLLRILGTGYRIITLQDIRTEIEQKEIEAWHKLIQILRHEIRNSVTPIASMTETIQMLLEDQHGRVRQSGEMTDRDLEDIHSGIRTIHDRSERLYSFVEKYRRLTRLPPPEKERIELRSFFNHIHDLHRKELDARGIHFRINPGPDNLILEADPSQLDQVLINLLKNSMEAVAGKKNPTIILSGGRDKRHVNLMVEDNGDGIESDFLQEIFLPFFTTRPDGTGIGLTLSRQIMNLHGGYLTAVSRPGKRTVFTLTFPGEEEK
jgi:nitrogen fixation/metabolism regulation signal transduction histidine kinase